MSLAKIDKLALKVFLVGLPLVAIMAGFDSLIGYGTLPSRPSSIQTLYHFSGLLFGIWMALSLYLSFRLLFSQDFREAVLTKFVRIRERDEREVYFSGRAAKMTFLASLAVLISLFCLSTFQVSLYQVRPEKAVNGKAKTITLGFNLDLMEATQKPMSTPNEPDAETDIAKRYFTYSGRPLSKGAIILFLILWQVAFYQYAIKRPGSSF